jgi:hypothetical protein
MAASMTVGYTYCELYLWAPEGWEGVWHRTLACHMVMEVAVMTANK